ncbi:MAG TPA: class I SAM-dependent methyltransferase [Bacteroidia bacterium]|nr:class I SAM-dependent methyltransferase [Bacteroidia bacterium]
MSTQKAYDEWSAIYDTNLNKTRDLEAVAARKMLAPITFRHVLEIGAGTGKNTVWYLGLASRIIAVDLSAEMLAKAKEKIGTQHNPECMVEFVQADITQPWAFGEACHDLVSFSLMLEHIADLDPVFEEVAKALMVGGHAYVGELHPFKQYLGSKAKFETAAGEVIVNCFNHHLSDFVSAAQKQGLQLIDVQEFFDDNDRNGVPRVLGLLFRKG